MEDHVEMAIDVPAEANAQKYWFGGHILFCIGLNLLGIYVVFESVRLSLPYLESGDATWSDMPGLSPIICSILLMLLTIPVIIKSVKAGGKLRYFISRDFRDGLCGSEAQIFYVVFASMLVYVFLLFPYLPYALATLIFLVGSMALLKLFTWKSVLVSAITSGALWFVFGVMFQINLPH